MADKAVLGFYMSINQNQKKLFFRLLLGLITNLLLYGMAVSGDILFHEEIGREAIIYSILPDGSNLKKIGQGLSHNGLLTGNTFHMLNMLKEGILLLEKHL